MAKVTKLCFDIDDCITYAPEFLVRLVDAFSDCQVSIVTFRADRAETEAYLDEIGMRYDHLYVSTDPVHGKKEHQTLPEWKADLVNTSIVPDVFFEDMPEVVCRVSNDIAVFMPCDGVIRDWIKSVL